MPLTITGPVPMAMPAPVMMAFASGIIRCAAGYYEWDFTVREVSPAQIEAVLTKKYPWMKVTLTIACTWIKITEEGTIVQVDQDLSLQHTRRNSNEYFSEALVGLLIYYRRAFRVNAPLTGTVASLGELAELEDEYESAMMRYLDRWGLAGNTIHINTIEAFDKVSEDDEMRVVNVGHQINPTTVTRAFTMIQKWGPQQEGRFAMATLSYDRNARVWQYMNPAIRARRLEPIHGEYQFVTEEPGGRITVGKRGHSAAAGDYSIARGSPMAFAGTVSFNRGALTGWDNGSGHYRIHPGFAFQAGFPLASFTDAAGRTIGVDPKEVRDRLYVVLAGMPRLLVELIVSYLYNYFSRRRQVRFQIM